MSITHDWWGQNPLIGVNPVLQVSIIPATILEYCLLEPAICSTLITADRNNYYI